MKLLLDTATFLWIVTEDPRLSNYARKLFLDPDNKRYLSAISTWEIALKNSLGRLSLPEAVDQYVPAQREKHGIESLPLEEEQTLYLARLPRLHRDPFDRMLVCQALAHGLVLLSPDPVFSQYPVRTIW